MRATVHAGDTAQVALRYSIDVPAATVVLEPAALDSLVSVTNARSELVFSDPPSSVEALGHGSVVVAGISKETPDGLLREVVSVKRTGSTLLVVTRPASLTQALAQGSFDVRHPLDASTITNPVTLPGVRWHDPLLTAAGLGAITVQLSTADGQALGIPCSPGVEMELSGSLTIAPSVDFGASWSLFGGLSAHLSGTVVETSNLTATASATGSCSKRLQLAEFPFPPFDVQVGPVPVVITPVVRIVLSVSGQVTATLEDSVTQQTTVTAGLMYSHGQLRPIHQFTSNFTNTAPTVPAISATAKAALGPELDLLLYGLAGPTVNVDGYMELDANPTTTPWWSLNGGLDAGAGLALDLLDGTIHVSVGDSDIISWQKTLAQSTTSPPPTTTTVVAPMAACTANSILAAVSIYGQEHGFTGQSFIAQDAPVCRGNWSSLLVTETENGQILGPGAATSEIVGGPDGGTQWKTVFLGEGYPCSDLPAAALSALGSAADCISV